MWFHLWRRTVSEPSHKCILGADLFQVLPDTCTRRVLSKRQRIFGFSGSPAKGCWARSKGPQLRTLCLGGPQRGTRTPPRSSCVTSDKSVNLSEPRFPQQNTKDDQTCHSGMHGRRRKERGAVLKTVTDLREATGGTVRSSPVTGVFSDLPFPKGGGPTAGSVCLSRSPITAPGTQ